MEGNPEDILFMGGQTHNEEPSEGWEWGRTVGTRDFTDPVEYGHVRTGSGRNHGPETMRS